MSRNIEDVKKEVFKKIDIKALGPNQGKKVKELKKIIEDKYVDIFQKSHFGIEPLTEAKFKDLSIEMKVKPNELQFNQSTGMIKNACMSSNCIYFMQPMKAGEMTEHMRLWKKSIPARFHMNVANLLKQKKQP